MHPEVLEDLKKYRARNGGGGSSILDDLRFQVEELIVFDALRFQGGKLIVLDALRFQGDEIPRQFEQFLISALRHRLPFPAHGFPLIGIKLKWISISGNQNKLKWISISSKQRDY